MEEKEKLNTNNNKNNSSDDEEENLEKDPNFKNEEELKKLFKIKNEEDTIKIKTNEVENALLLKEKTQKLRGMKEDANELLKKEKYEEAIDKYKETINTLLDEVSTMKIDMKKLESLKDEIIIPCYQNIALCNMKLQKWIRVKNY